MSNKTYRLLVADESETYASTDGSLDVIAYVARKLDLGADDSYDVKLTETDGISRGDTRTVLTLAADGETIDFLLGRALRKERKSGAVESATGESPAEVSEGQPEPAFA